MSVKSYFAVERKAPAEKEKDARLKDSGVVISMLGFMLAQAFWLRLRRLFVTRWPVRRRFQR